MVAKAGSHLLAATALAVLAGAGLGADSARAQGATCLASPNGPAPAGTHWYYKTDQATQQKCWYTRPADQAAQVSPAQRAPSQTTPAQGDSDNPDSDAAAAPEQPAAVSLPPAAAPPVAPRAAPPALAAPRRATAPIARVPVPTADPRGEQQPVMAATTAGPTSAAVPAVPDRVAWPDPPSLPQTPGIAGASSPFPPPPSVDSQTGASGPSGTAPAPVADNPPTTDSATPNAAPALDPAAQSSPNAGKPADDKPTVKTNADPSTAAKPPGRISVLLVLAGLIVLVILGVLLRRLVEHTLGRRRVIKLARQEPRLAEPAAVPTPTLLRRAPSVVPAHGQAEQRASEVENALRQLAHNMRQPRPAANGTTGRSGTAIRS